MPHIQSVLRHPLVIGLAIAGVVLMTTTHAGPGPAQTTLVEYMPHPRDCVQLRADQPYIVPPGKIFTLTALGQTAANGTDVNFTVGGRAVVGTGGTFSTRPEASMATVAGGCTVRAGETILVTGGFGVPSNGRAWGYLADE